MAEASEPSESLTSRLALLKQRAKAAWRQARGAASGNEGGKDVSLRESANPAFTGRLADKEAGDTEEVAVSGVPCGGARRFFCGTRKRRQVCGAVSLLLLVLVIFLGVRGKQALEVASTRAQFASVELSSLCSSEFSFRVVGTLSNPSVVGATVQATSMEVRSAEGVLGYLKTPSVPVAPGASALEVSASFSICDACVAPLRQVMQRWLDGERVSYKVTVPLAARFGAGVFLVPFTYATTMTFDNFLDSYFNKSLSYAEREALALRDAQAGRSALGQVALGAYDNATLTGRLGLNMTRAEPDAATKQRNIDTGFGNYAMLAQLPPLGFRAAVDGREVGTGASRAGLFGGAELLAAELRTRWAHVAAVNHAADLFQAQADMPYSIVAEAAAAQPADQVDAACFLTRLVEGVVVRNTLEFFPAVTAWQAARDKTLPPKAKVVDAALNAVDSQGRLDGTVDVDVRGTQLFYLFEGALPAPLTFNLRTNSSAPAARDSVGRLVLLSPVNITQAMSPLVRGVRAVLDLDNFTLVEQVAEQVLGLQGRENPFLFAQVASTDILLGALLQTYVVALPLRSDDTQAEVERAYAAGTGRRALQQQAQATAQLQPTTTLSLNVSDSSADLGVSFAGLSRDFFAGYGVKLSAGELRLGAYPFGGSALSEFLVLSWSAVDVTGQQASNLTVAFSLRDATFKGKFVIDLIKAAFQRFDPLTLFISGNYGGVPIASSQQRLARRKFPSAAGDAGAASSLVEVKHIEAKSLQNNVIKLRSAFAINLPGLSASSLNLPSVAVGLVECSNATAPVHLLSVATDPTTVALNSAANVAAGNELAAVIDFASTDTVRLLSTAALWAAGNQSTLCVREHPDPAKNSFLSGLVSAFDVRLAVNGLSNETIDQVVNVTKVSELELAFTAGPSSVCTNVTVNLTAANAGWPTSLGWGALQWALTDARNNAQVLTWSAPAAFIGAGCASPFATPAACGNNALSFSVCIATVNADLEAGALAVRNVAVALGLDQTPVPFKLSGYSLDRRATGAAAQERIPVSATFTVPAKARDILFNAAGTRASLANVSPSALDLKALIDRVELSAVKGNRVTAEVVPLRTGGVFNSFTLTLPKLRARVASAASAAAAETELMQIAATVPPKADRWQAAVIVDLASFDELLRVGVLLRDSPTAVLRVSSVKDPANFAERLVPSLTLVDKSAPVAPTAAPTGPVLNMALSANSGVADATLLFAFSALKDVLPVPLVWPAGQLRLSYASAAAGLITLPAGGSLGPAGTGTGTVAVVLSGAAAPALAGALFTGANVPVALASVEPGGAWDVAFSIPKELLAALALGTAGNAGDAGNSIALRELNILGGDAMGSDVVLPCLVQKLCNNLAIDEKAQKYSALTLGLEFTIPQSLAGNAVSFTIALRSELDVRVQGNGADMGTLTLLPFTLDSARTGAANPLQAALRFNWNARQLDTIRFIVDRVATSDQLTLSMSGATGASHNYLSNLLGALAQDFFVDPQAADPSKPAIVGAAALSVKSASASLLTVQAVAPVNYLNGATDIGIALPLGQVSVDVLHLGQRVASAAVTANQPDGASFSLLPSARQQDVTLQVSAYRDGPSSALTMAMNHMFQRFVFSDDITLELNARFVPAQASKKFNPKCDVASSALRAQAAGCGFSLRTFLTYPKVDGLSEFIKAFTLSFGSSAWDSFRSGDVKVNAVKTLYNSLPFEVLVSHFAYQIVLVDSDGTVIEEACRDFSRPTACNNNFISSSLRLCFEPYKSAARKENIIQSAGGSTTRPQTGTLLAGDPNLPGTSLLANSQKFLPSRGTGDVPIVINPMLEDGGRVWNEYSEKGLVCADIKNGRMVVGVQTPGTTCNDAGVSAANLKCTFVLDLSFSLPDFSLLPGDTCRGPLNAQENLNAPITLGSGYDLAAPQALFSGVQTVAGGATTFWTASKISLLDSFTVDLVYTVTDDDTVSLVFGSSTALESAAIDISTVGCNVAKVRNAPTQSSAVVHSLGKGKRATLSIIYDPYTSRVRIGSKHSAEDRDTAWEKSGLSEFTEYADFDFTPMKNVSGTVAFMGIKYTPSKSAFTTKTVAFPKTDSARSTLVDTADVNNLNPVEGKVGFLSFQSRDSKGRRRGQGGESWTVTLTNADTGSAATGALQPTAQDLQLACAGVAASSVVCSTVTAACVCDLSNGQYRVVYKFPARGRYSVNVASPTAAINTGKLAELSSRIFVRKA